MLFCTPETDKQQQEEQQQHSVDLVSPFLMFLSPHYYWPLVI